MDTSISFKSFEVAFSYIFMIHFSCGEAIKAMNVPTMIAVIARCAPIAIFVNLFMELTLSNVALILDHKQLVILF